MRKTGWLPFGLWALPGAALGIQVSVVGALVLPLGVLVTLLLLRVTRPWPESLGALVGIAAVCLVIAALNTDYWTCPPSGQVVTRTGDSVIAEGCGGLNPWPWLLAGTTFAAVAVLGYSRARRTGP